MLWYLSVVSICCLMFGVCCVCYVVLNSVVLFVICFDLCCVDYWFASGFRLAVLFG